MTAGEDDVSIRRAVPDDAGALAVLAERCFREAWDEFNTPANMAAYCAANFTTELVRDDLVRPGVRYLLAQRGQEGVGYLRMVPGQAPRCVRATAPIEISRVYVLRGWHGRGVGPELLRTGLEEAVRAGHDIAWLAVWQRAPRALAFYRKWGFETVGTARFALGSDVQDDFVMQRSL